MTETAPSPINALIERLIAREGGFVDNPSDRGGATCWGVTIGQLRDWRRTPVSREDVQNLTREEAASIYRTVYFTAPGFDHVQDPRLQELLFDYGVNSGPGAATRALQTALGVTADGVAGPITLGALAKYDNPERLYWRVLCRRYNALLRYIGSDAEQAQFAAGWANRLETFERDWR